MNRHEISARRTVWGLAILSISFAGNSVQAQVRPASEEHKGIEKEVGTWDAESKFWMVADTEPMLSKAIEVNKMLGTMWLISDYKSEIMGTPFVGHGQYGYDPHKKKYIGTWIDTASPYLSLMEGTMDEETHTLTMMSTGMNPMTGKEEVSKMVSVMIDDDHKKFEVFKQVEGQDGKWWKQMEISYTRKK